MGWGRPGSLKHEGWAACLGDDDVLRITLTPSDTLCIIPGTFGESRNYLW